MAQPGSGVFASILSRLTRQAGSSTALVPVDQGSPKSLLPADEGQPKRLMAEGDYKRVTGNNAGLPGSSNLVPDGGVPTGAIPMRGEAPSEYQRNGTAVRRLGWEQHPVVQSCVRVIADVASAVPLQVYRKNPSRAKGYSDEIEVLTSKDPLQRLVDAPNSFFSAKRWRKFLFTHELIYGNSFNLLERPVTSPNVRIAPPPQSLRVIRPEDILTVYVNIKGYPLWYYWRDTLGYMHTSPVQDILHVRDLSVFSFVFGYPRGAAALNDIVGDNEASQFVRQMVTNSGTAGVWLLANSETTPEQARAVEAQLHEQFVSRGGRGRTKVIGGINSVETVAFSLRDLEFPDLRMIAREDICTAFGVDPRMIGLASATKDGGLSGVQYREARERLIKHTIEPLMDDIVSEMNLWLAPEFGDVYLRFDPDALAQMIEDKTATSTRVLLELAGGARTVEETREVLDLPPDMDPMHLLATNTPLTPVAVAEAGDMAALAAGAAENEDGEEPETEEDEADESGAGKGGKEGDTEKDLQGDANQDPNQPGRKPNLSDGEQEPEPKQRRQPTAGEAYDVLAVARGQRFLTRSIVLSDVQKASLWRQFDQRATREEAAYRRSALMLFGEERGVVNRILDEMNRQVDEDLITDEAAIEIAQKTIARFYQANGEARRRWQDRFHPLIGQTYGKGAAQAVDAIGSMRSLRAKPKKKQNAPEPGAIPDTVPIDFALENPQVQVAIQARAKRLAEHVGKTTSRIVTDVIAIGRHEGMGISQIARLIDKAAFGSGAGSRSVMIARTETIGALNQGEFDTAGSSGAVAGKEWLTEGDDRVRETHMDCEKEGVLPIDDAFRTNRMRYPGDPVGDAAEVINCRCTLLYYDTVPE